MPGIKKIVGGILAADITHSKCGQKMLCDEMAPEVSLLHFLIKYQLIQSYFLLDTILVIYTYFQKIEITEAIDPVKRTIVRIPRLVKPRGRLRWIGDAVVNTVKTKYLKIF